MKKILKNTFENIQSAAGLMLFPFMGFMAVCNVLGFNSLAEVFTLFLMDR